MPNDQDIAEQYELLEAHRRTLGIYLQQQALQGNLSASAAVVNGIRTTRKSIAHCKSVLRSWGQLVEDLPDDGDSTSQPYPQTPLAMLRNHAPLLLGALAIIALIAIIIRQQGASNSFNGSNNTGVILNNGSIEQVTIQNGDSPEVRQQKVEQAKRLVVQDVQTNIGSIDARLSFVAAALQPVPDPLGSARQTVAPASQELARAGYSQLIANERAASLQQSLNSRPLRLEFGGPLVQVLMDSSAEVSSIRSFYDQLATTNDASESLMQTLRDAARDAGDDAEMSYWLQRIELARDVLRNRSQTAYLFGLLALHDMGAGSTDLGALYLRELTPSQMPSRERIQELIPAILDETERLIERRKSLIQQREQMVATLAAEYQKLNQALEIQPSDTMEQVIAKARSLRDLGRLDQAVDAFARYGEMFSSDPDTTQYARTAQVFTRQMGMFSVRGGVYVFQVVENSSAQKAGIMAGDILIKYNGQLIETVTQASQAFQQPAAAAMVPIEWLRLNSSGELVRLQAQVPPGTLGVGLMLI